MDEEKVLEDVKAGASRRQVAITGSFAAVRLAPVAAPALVVAYTDDVEIVSRELRLLPADEGGNVVLLSPYDPVVWDRNQSGEGLRYVAPSQTAIDCLTGNSAAQRPLGADVIEQADGATASYHPAQLAQRRKL